MSSQDHPAINLVQFIRDQGRAGKYSPSQQRLLSTSVALLIRYAPDRHALTVGGVERRLLEIEDPFSGPDRTLEPMSLRSYQSRVRKVLRDYFQNTENPKMLASERKSEAPVYRHQAVVPLSLPNDQHAELRYPADLRGTDFEALSQVLRRLADLLQAQGEAVSQNKSRSGREGGT